jgi:hypothetical protein
MDVSGSLVMLFSPFFIYIPAILILERLPCGSGFPAAKTRGKMPLTQRFGSRSTS